jgi:hypothetical protein
MGKGRYLQARPDLIVREEGDEGEALIFDPGTERIKVLNHTGLLLWSLLDGRHTSDDLVKALSGAHPSVDGGVLAGDVDAFVQDLLDLGFLERVGEV